MDFKDPKSQKLILAGIAVAGLGYLYFFATFVPFGYRAMAAEKKERFHLLQALGDDGAPDRMNLGTGERLSPSLDGPLPTRSRRRASAIGSLNLPRLAQPTSPPEVDPARGAPLCLPSPFHRLEGQALPGSPKTVTLTRLSSHCPTVDCPKAAPIRRVIATSSSNRRLLSSSRS